MIKRVQKNIFRYQLFEYGSKIVLGISGGPDSVCLLDIFYKLKKKYELELIVAHVNYGLRDKDSKKDEQLVKDLAEKYSLPIETSHPTHEKLQTKNLEEKLRNIRYEFFERIRREYEAQCIAVAHNLNDQAETVMMRIVRGTGLRGLGAIKFKNENIIRPLLNIPRKDILAYLRKNDLPYRIDKTNLGTNFTRNKIRNQLFPLFRKNFNPNIDAALFNLSQSAIEDYDFISKFSESWLIMNKKMSANKLRKLHPSIFNEVIRQMLEKHKPALREIELAHVEEIRKIINSSKSKRQMLTFKGLKIERIDDKLLISHKTKRA